MFSNTKVLDYSICSGCSNNCTDMYDAGYGFWVRPDMKAKIEGLVPLGAAIAKRWPSRDGRFVTAKLLADCTEEEIAEIKAKEGPLLSYELFEIAHPQTPQDGSKFYYIHFLAESAPYWLVGCYPSDEDLPLDMVVVPNLFDETAVPLKPGETWHHFALAQVSDLMDIFKEIRTSPSSFDIK